MKPCREYKEQIALAMVEGELIGERRRPRPQQISSPPGHSRIAAGEDARAPSRELQQHITQCPACRMYAEELEEVCGSHRRRAETLPEAEAPMRLNRRVRDVIGGTDGSSCCGVLIRASLRRLLQGLGVAAAATIVIAILIHLSSDKATPLMNTAESRGVPRGEMTNVSEPTLAAYHHRLTRSVEELEASLRMAPPVSGGELLKVSSGIDALP